MTVLLVDGGDRQTVALAKAYHKLGYRVATLNGSKLDVGYATRYADIRVLEPSIVGDKSEHLRQISRLLSTGLYDVAVTSSDDTAEGLSQMRAQFGDKIAMVDPACFALAYDKIKTMQICMEQGIPCPQTYPNFATIDAIPFADFHYPMVIKPRKSYGAIGYHRADNEAALRSLCKEIGKDLHHYVIQEYIPQTDLQYECAMFIDQNHEVKTACVFSKNRWFPVSGGSSTCNITVDRPDIVESCTKLLKHIGWRGAADIDLIQDPRDGIAKILEINPRVSGSVKVVLKSGVNIAQQIVQLAQNQPVTPYLRYKTDVRMRCLHTDLLWFLKSPNRFRSKPSWFSWRHTTDQIFDLCDIKPFFTFSLQAVKKYKQEMKKRS